MLFKYKVDLDLRDDFNRTAVYVAVKNDQPAIRRCYWRPARGRTSGLGRHALWSR